MLNTLYQDWQVFAASRLKSLCRIKVDEFECFVDTKAESPLKKRTRSQHRDAQGPNEQGPQGHQ